jgi:pimeloyl-ACP methyl ester carboxylesterase
MHFSLDRKKLFAYTAAHELDPKKSTIVFVHGAGLDHSLFGLQSRYFAYHGWNVLAVDLPGHGRSEGPPLASIEGMAQWVFDALDSLKVEKAGIVGHSMGSLAALECAAQQPGRIERIALIGIAYPMKVGEAFLEAARSNSQTAFDMETIWGHAAQVPLAGNPNPGMWMHGDMLARLARLAPDVLYNDLRACNDYAGGEASAAKVKCPALFIVGKRDAMTPPRNLNKFTEKFGNAKTVMLDSSGHSLMAEAPDATLDALTAFFSPP